MSFFTLGTPTISSTSGLATNPSTSTIIAEIDSTQLARHIVQDGGANFQVTWIVGGATNAVWQLEQCLSTGLDISTSASTGSDANALTFAYTPTNQSAQYITKHRLIRGDRLRVRVNAAIGAGVVGAKILAEPLA